ncbi:MAG: Slp family lipoprotein [Chitinivibrionales bacterium]|nr:Slp family lipoprotein [Chitinivibrionales bacterium]
MKPNFLYKIAGSVIATSLLAGCASYVISENFRKETAKDVIVPMVQENPQKYIGTKVIWGGQIVEVTNDSAGSHLWVFETMLDNDEYPMEAQHSRGRFIATTTKFLDPLIYIKGRKVTIGGEVLGVANQKLGNGTYPYPEVKIDELRYWIPYPAYRYYPYYPDYSPWWHYPWWYDRPYDDFYGRHRGR